MKLVKMTNSFESMEDASEALRHYINSRTIWFHSMSEYPPNYEYFLGEGKLRKFFQTYFEPDCGLIYVALTGCLVLILNIDGTSPLKFINVIVVWIFIFILALSVFCIYLKLFYEIIFDTLDQSPEMDEDDDEDEDEDDDEYEDEDEEDDEYEDEDEMGETDF